MVRVLNRAYDITILIHFSYKRVVSVADKRTKLNDKNSIKRKQSLLAPSVERVPLVTC